MSRVWHSAKHFSYKWCSLASFSARRASSIMDLMNSLLHATDFRSPLFSTLVLTTIIAYDSQNIAAISAVAARSERLYHLSRVLTCLACAWLSLLLPLLRTRAAAADWPGLLGGMDGGRLTATLNWRQVALTGAVSVWAIRCELEHSADVDPPDLSQWACSSLAEAQSMVSILGSTA